ncbi:toll/interleukin-1 receptor domain-containing protein [Mucilaginibacter celer]|uniref:TIR domain-containing protein n=1 Tax=Mucilaginibacter celer TaxID=2305508 RepID=A0A494VLS6_9SPHI|nr:toll/interleukin-1 receptor domain-containing protein [Mucilaginibacter celer]AYL96217.1 TIR domain-containing protein [Mucilaginibacter celer]
MKYDIFLSYATEEKEKIARPLAIALSELDYKVWFDANVMSIGDSIKKTIDDGILNSNYGIIIISKSYLSKHWTTYELNWFAAKEKLGVKNYIIPIWHEIRPNEIESFLISLDNSLKQYNESLPAIVIEVLKNFVNNFDITTEDIADVLANKIKAIINKPAVNKVINNITEEEENVILKAAYTIELYNEWHWPNFKKSIKYTTEWITANKLNNITMIPLSEVEDRGGILEYHVFEIIHFYEKWALLSKAKVINVDQIFMLLGEYSSFFEENLISPLLKTPEKNEDFKNLLHLIKTELLNK